LPFDRPAARGVVSASKVDKGPWEARIAFLGRTRRHAEAFGWVVGG
jgi:hypothetical protein